MRRMIISDLKNEIPTLKTGERVLLSGDLYVARDAAHKRMIESLDLNESLPFDITDQIIFYMGPCPAAPGEVIGPAGPTTSHRMDAYSPKLFQMGLLGTIGKGNVSQSVIDAITARHGVYFACVGGTGCLSADRIKSAEVIAYPDLGAEAIRHIRVEDFPVIVAVDSFGNNVFNEQRKIYQQRIEQ